MEPGEPPSYRAGIHPSTTPLAFDPTSPGSISASAFPPSWGAQMYNSAAEGMRRQLNWGQSEKSLQSGAGEELTSREILGEVSPAVRDWGAPSLAGWRGGSPNATSPASGPWLLLLRPQRWIYQVSPSHTSRSFWVCKELVDGNFGLKADFSEQYRHK